MQEKYRQTQAIAIASPILVPIKNQGTTDHLYEYEVIISDAKSMIIQPNEGIRSDDLGIYRLWGRPTAFSYKSSGKGFVKDIEGLTGEVNQVCKQMNVSDNQFIYSYSSGFSMYLLSMFGLHKQAMAIRDGTTPRNGSPLELRQIEDHIFS